MLSRSLLSVRNIHNVYQTGVKEEHNRMGNIKQDYSQAYFIYVFMNQYGSLSVMNVEFIYIYI
jgi:hypothetical protein